MNEIRTVRNRRRVVAGVLLSMAVACGLTLATTPAAEAATAQVTATPTTPPLVRWSTPRLTKLVAEARRMTTMHIPYSNGGHGTHPAPIGASVDCSGLVRQLYSYAFGVDIGRGTGDSMVRTSGRFYKTTRPVPGDVILIGNGGRAPAFHLMIYVGNDGGHPTGVASPTWGETVQYQHPWMPYWAGNVMGYWHFKGATATDSSPYLTRPSTRVHLDWAVSGAGTVHVDGWSFDPINHAYTTRVDVYDGSRKLGSLWANLCRNDVSRTYKVGCKHGFWGVFKLPPGPHTIRVLSNHTGSDGVANRWSNSIRMTVTA